MAPADRASAVALDGWEFFDQGLIDAASGRQHLTGEQVLATLARIHRYHRCVFLTPPWREIFMVDRERRHAFGTAVAEYSGLLQVYPSPGYGPIVLPKLGWRNGPTSAADAAVSLPLHRYKPSDSGVRGPWLIGLQVVESNLALG
jgi:AAA domain